MPRPEERSALRLLLLDLNMEVVGEAADWSTTLAKCRRLPPRHVIGGMGFASDQFGCASSGGTARGLPNAIVVVLISHLDARHQAALSADADAFISKSEHAGTCGGTFANRRVRKNSSWRGRT